MNVAVRYCVACASTALEKLTEKVLKACWLIRPRRVAEGIAVTAGIPVMFSLGSWLTKIDVRVWCENLGKDIGSDFGDQWA